MPKRRTFRSWTWVVLLICSSVSAQDTLPAQDATSDAVGTVSGVFRVDESGQASYQIPIAVTPGVAGLAPGLALTYNSQSGDGPAGYGWSISGGSQISRCRRTSEHGDSLGADNYVGLAVRFDAGDVFCLDGQRLLLIGGTYGSANSEYRAEQDPFTRITALGGNNGTNPASYTGPLSFRVERRDGTVQSYGETEDARLTVAGCGGTTGVACANRQWLLNRVEDSSGNYLEYVYAKWLNSASVAASAIADEIHLAEVRYTGKRRLPGQSAPDAAPYARVSFSYAPRTLAAQHAGWQSGAPYRLTQELTGIGVHEPLATEVRHYALEQVAASSGSGRRLLQRVYECSDSSKTLCFPPTEFIFEQGSDEPTAVTLSEFGSTAFGEMRYFKVGDIDGDGRQDIVWAGPHSGCSTNYGVRVLFATKAGAGTSASPQPLSLTSHVHCLQRSDQRSADEWHLVDIDGDGRDDLLMTGPLGGSWSAHRSLGRPATGAAPVFEAANTLGVQVPVGSTSTESAELLVLDVNGDGLPDLLYPTYGQIAPGLAASLAVRLGRIDRSGPVPRRSFSQELPLDFGLKPGDPCHPDTPPGWPQTFCAVSFSRGGGQARPADLDGDGRGDVQLFVTRYALFGAPQGDVGGPWVFASPEQQEEWVRQATQRGAGPVAQEQAWYFFVSSDIASGRANFSQYDRIAIGTEGLSNLPAYMSMADVNGDGLMDFAHAAAPNYTEIRVRLNTGRGFAQSLIAATGVTHADRLQWVDLTGDGRTDLVYPVAVSGPQASCGGQQVGTADQPWCMRPAMAGTSTNWFVLDSARLLPALHTSIAGRSVADFESFTMDIDGDGVLDFVRLARNVFSNAPEVRIVRRDTPHTTRDTITRITDGLGAETRIHYQPLTNRAVYRPGKVAWAQTLGRGAPVFDLLAPMYVVASVESSAPLRGQPEARIATNYRYSAARMQSGGRGFLGFAAIDTFDANEISTLGAYGVTRSQYSQAFPFVGAPTATQKAIGAGTPSVGEGVSTSCRQNPEAALDCFSPTATEWTDTPIGLRDGESGSGARLLSSTINVYQAQEFGVPLSCPTGESGFATDAVEALARGGQLAPAEFLRGAGQAQVSRAPVLLGTLEEGFSATTNVQVHERLSLSFSLFCYEDGYGNLTRGFTDVRDPASGFTERLHFTTTTSAFDNGNPLLSTQPWRLGRMTQSSVEKRLRPQSTTPQVSVRKAHFTYDLASQAKTGQLLSERAEVNGTHATRTLYTLDDYGNRVAAFVCSDQEWDGSTLTDAECRDPTRVRMRPTQANGEPTAAVHRYSRTEFDSRGRYPVRTYAPFFVPTATNEMLERVTEQVLARNVFGQATHTRDTNGRNVYARFGAMGRAFATELQGGGTAVTRLRLCGGSVSCPAETVYRQHTSPNDGPQQWSYHDRLGRAVVTVSESFEAGNPDRNFSAICAFSDVKARPSLVSVPFFLSAQTGAEPSFSGAGSNPCAASSTRYEEKRFDLIGRPTADVAADGSGTQFAYSGQTIEQTNARLQRSWVVRNVLGQVVREVQADPVNPTLQGMAVTHEYDAEGQLRFTRRNAGAGEILHERRYDLFGRLERSLDPDRGEERFSYNAAGEVIRRVDAGGQVVEQHYDAQGRLWKREAGSPRPPEPPGGSVIFASGFELPGTVQVRQVDTWQFDVAANGLGQIAIEERETPGEPVFRRVFAYDSLGRTQDVTTLIQGVSRSASTAYDSLGRVWRQTDATGGVLEQVHTPRGFVEQLRNGNNLGQVYNRVLQVNPRGQVTRERRGDSAAMEVTRHYDALRGWLTTIDSGSGQSLQKLRYQFDVLGRLEWRDDQRLNQRETFGYDELNRLRTAHVQLSGMNSLQTMNLTYDALGNLCSKNGTLYTYAGRSGCAGSAGVATASPHAVTAIGGRVIHYHSQGHMRFKTGATSAQDRYTEFNGLEQLVLAMVGSVLSPTAELQLDYAPGGDRYLRRDRNSAGLTTTRIWGNVEEVIRPNGTVETRRYLAGAAIETKQGSSFNLGTPELRYLFTDHLGSLDVIANASGGVIERLSFDAHGRRRQVSDWTSSVPPAASTITPRGFTGHEHLDAYGLIHMNGRVYDPELGRFLQADPMLDVGIQGLNRYSYVLNNPLSLTDPSGYSSFGDFLRVVVAVAITVYTGGWAAGYWGSALTTTQAFGVVVAGGFAAGAIQSGTLKGGLQGAFTAAAFFGVGSYFESAKWAKSANDATKLSAIGRTAKIVAHGVTGGVLSDVQGGKFAHGFASAGFSEAAGPLTESMPTQMGRGVVHALIGGTASKLSGGKFSNGAVTAAMSFAFNTLAHEKPEYLSADEWKARTTKYETLESTADEDFAAFGRRVGRRLIELGEEHGFEFTGAFGRRAAEGHADGFQYAIVIQTQNAYTISAAVYGPPESYEIMTNHLGRSLTIHNHGVGRNPYTDLDRRYQAPASGTRIHRTPAQDRMNFSLQDRANPGLLATPEGVRWLKPGTRGRLVEVDL